MAKKHFYGIKSDSASDIFESWDECQKALSSSKYMGNKSYKGFVTRKEAEAFINETTNIHGIYQDELLNPEIDYAYVDGSYNSTTKKVGAGFVIVQNFQKKYSDSFTVTEDAYLASRQIGGELASTQQAITYAAANHFSSLTIAYDYMGIEKFATGEWKADTDVSKAYAAWIQNFKKANPTFSLHFVKVSSSHSNNEFNDMADQLAVSGTL